MLLKKPFLNIQPGENRGMARVTFRSPFCVAGAGWFWRVEMRLGQGEGRAGIHQTCSESEGSTQLLSYCGWLRNPAPPWTLDGRNPINNGINV